MAALHVAIHEKWHWWGWPVPVLEHWHRTRRFWHYHLKSFDNDDFRHFWLRIFQDIPILELAMAWRASPEAKAAAQKLSTGPLRCSVDLATQKWMMQWTAA